MLEKVTDLPSCDLAWNEISEGILGERKSSSPSKPGGGGGGGEGGGGVCLIHLEPVMMEGKAVWWFAVLASQSHLQILFTPPPDCICLLVFH